MGKYFGTDGFRGEANVGLTVMHAFEIGRYLGWYYGKDHKARIVIGKDTRRSSYMFESALCAGLTASGADGLPAAAAAVRGAVLHGTGKRAGCRDDGHAALSQQKGGLRACRRAFLAFRRARAAR